MASRSSRLGADGYAIEGSSVATVTNWEGNARNFRLRSLRLVYLQGSDMRAIRLRISLVGLGALEQVEMHEIHILAYVSGI